LVGNACADFLSPACGHLGAPVTFLFAAMLYTGALSLRFLSIPLFTVFKNLTIIAIAYGELFVFGSKVTTMMLASFALMVRLQDLSVSE
jgi:GDP-mannose transporter